MVGAEKKRSPRIPLSSEEVANFIKEKKNREHKKLLRFKKSFSYKFMNVFNVVSFFIYWELLFCFFGPCNYQTHYASNVFIRFGDELGTKGNRVISEVRVLTVNDQEYKLVVNDFIEKPSNKSSFQIGKDYILQKEIKGKLENSDNTYRIFSASPVLFLAAFVIFISIITFSYNLNENLYSLRAVTLLNFITILYFLLLP